MKKVLFTSMVLLSVLSWTGNVYAQDAAGGTEGTETPATAQAKVTFTPSADGKTLTISGQGDLTTLTTTDYSARVFTDNAVGFVFTDDKGTKVNAKDLYNSGKTYYQAEYDYTKLDMDVPTNGNGFNEVTIAFDETKISNLYNGYYDNNGNIVIQNKVKASDNPEILGNVTWKYDGNVYYHYFTCDEELPYGTAIPMGDLETRKVGLLTKEGLYEHFKITYQVTGAKSLFISHKGSEDKTALVVGVIYIYQSGDSFYEGTPTYVIIADNDAFFGEKGEHSDYIQADSKELSFNDLLLRKITERAYEKVEFINESSDACLINSATIQSILFPNAGENTVIKELDLGQVTLNNLSAADLGRSGDANTCHSLETLTLPLTNKTTVTSEITKTTVEKMVVPQGIIPNGYTFKGNNLKKVNVPEGYEIIASSAFNEISTLTDISLPTTLEEIGEKAFWDCRALRNVNLLQADLMDTETKASLKVIGAFAFSGATSLSKLVFPASLRKVKDGAFVNLPNIKNIKLNAGIEYIGNGAFGLTGEVTDQTVIEMPASLKYLGPGSFVGRKFNDVYFLGEDAPLSPLGVGISVLGGAYNDPKNPITAFMASMHMGNNGFDPGTNKGAGKLADKISDGYANRENYNNQGDYFTILHYPKGLDNDAAEKYTDITRVYETWKMDNGKFVQANLKTVGKEDMVLEFNGNKINGGNATSIGQVNPGYEDTYLGSQYVWPSQNQWMRSYICNSLGLKWDGVSKYNSENLLTYEQVQLLREAGYTEDDYPTKADLAKIAFLGTRQFTIANADANADKDKEEEPEYPIVMKPGHWWTLCVPFNMTKKQVLDTFGSQTQVCLFNGVDRQIGVNNLNRIFLMFTQSVLNNSSTLENKKAKSDDGKWDYGYIKKSEAPEDDDIVIWAHESYMIKPYNGEQSDQDVTFVVKNYVPVEGNPLPTVVVANNKEIGQEDDHTKEYRFIGNYIGNDNTAAKAVSVKIPQYSYVYAKTANSDYKFRFYAGTTATWKPNKSLVQTNYHGGGKIDNDNFFGNANQSSVAPTGAKQASFFGDDSYGEVTGIENVTIVAGTDVLTPIFNLEGKMVRSDGDTEGLSKGVYIKAGKKFIVK